MDGLASFAHDPILPLHDDGDSDFGESSDGRAEQSARNGDNADQESNELLQPVFGDGYFNDRKCSVGSVGESSNSVGNKNDRITDYGARGLSPSHELSREQEAEAQLLNSLDNFQSHISSGGQFAELGANHAHAMSTYNISSSTGHDRPTHYMIQNHSSMQPRQSLRVPQNQDSTLVGHQRTEIRDKPPHYLVSSESNQQGITLQTQQNQSVRPIHETASRLVENVLRFPRSVAVMRPMASERPPVTVPSQSDDELVHMSASIMELPGDDSDDASWTETVSKKQRIDAPQPQALLSTRTSPATASHTARTQHMPQWMNGAARLQQQQQQLQQQINPPSRQAVAVHPGATLSDYRPTLIKSHMTPVLSAPKVMQHKPNMLEIPEDYISTWEAPLPSHLYRRPQGRRRYELSLVNVKEFTITGLPISWEGPPSSLAGLRKKIKELSKAHGKATYERTKDGSDGRWRIPIVRNGANTTTEINATNRSLCRIIHFSCREPMPLFIRT